MYATAKPATASGTGLQIVNQNSSQMSLTQQNPLKSQITQGDNMSVSSLSMGQLANLPGYRMLQYLRSDQFG